MMDELVSAGIVIGLQIASNIIEELGGGKACCLIKTSALVCAYFGHADSHHTAALELWFVCGERGAIA